MEGFNQFNEMIRNYQYENIGIKDRLYLRKINYEYQPIVAVMDFKQNKMFTPNNEYDMTLFDPEFVEFFRNVSCLENRQLDKIPLNQDVLDASDELLDENIIPEYERPPKNEFDSTREQVKLAFHYEMVLLARLEDRLGLTKDKLLHKIETIGTREGIEVSEKRFIGEYGLNEAVEEMSEAIEEPDEAELDMDNPVFDTDEPVFDNDFGEETYVETYDNGDYEDYELSM